MDEPVPSAPGASIEAPVLSDPADALAAYASEWPELAAPLIGEAEIADAARYRATLQKSLGDFLKAQSTGPELVARVAAMRAILNHPSVEQFKLALAEDARSATQERLESGVVHTLWGVTPIINLNPMSAAARRLGVVADTVCYQTYRISSAFDVVLERQYPWALKNDPIAYSWLVFAWAMLRYDVFHTFYDRGLLMPFGGYGSPNFGVNVEEMRLLRIAGKRLYCFAYGADNRTRRRTLDAGPVNFCMHCPEPGKFCICDDESAEQMFSVIDQHTTANVASGLSIDYVPNSYELHYLIVDVDSIQSAAMETEPARPLRVLHAPNHSYFKGSQFLIDAVKELQAEGEPIELTLISGVSQAQVVEAMRKADIVADQFIAGFYGQTAIEAMALGRPAMCFVRDPGRAAAPDELPLINCAPDAIKNTLRRLARDRSELAEIGRRSRRYVERHHSLPAFASRLRALYAKTADFPETVHLAEAPPPSGVEPTPLCANRSLTTAMAEARAGMRSALEQTATTAIERARRSRLDALLARQDAAAARALAADREIERREASSRAAGVGERLRHVLASRSWRMAEALLPLAYALRGRRPPPQTPHVAQPTALTTGSEAALADFQRAVGRPLRVLHIGNIANNAYNNAKIQRARGIEADVLALDEYHVMASPEWEDADFSGDHGDDFFPDWSRVNLKGFRRPDWFVQGPVDPAVRYLLAKAAGARSARGMRRWLGFERWLMTRRSKLRQLAHRLILWSTKRTVSSDVPANALLLQRWGALLQGWSKLAPPGLARGMRRSGRRAMAMGRTAEGRARPAEGEGAADILGAAADGPYARILNRWRHPYLRLLFDRYDVVQCYATYTAIPFMAGRTEYVAYEHGTLRTIPFTDTPEGRMCKASYAAAQAVFVTNSDNLDAAVALGLEPSRTVALPHAVDSDALLAFAARRGKRPTLPVARFFTATRQHWVDGDPGWAKGNDRAIRALALVRETGRRCVLRAVEWGVDLAASKALADSLGVADMIEWVPVMPKRRLWREYLDCDAVLDQFVVPAMGGVTFEALLFGRRVITRIDAADAERFFGAAPPVYNCESVQQIARAMMRVIDDPADLAGDGRANQTWMVEHHGAAQIVATQVATYASLGRLDPEAGTRRGVVWSPARPNLAGRAHVLARAALRAGRRTALGLLDFRAHGRTLRRAAVAAAVAVFRAGGGLALRLAIPIGRMLTARRMRAGRARSLWGVTPILTLPLLARCDRLLGLHSSSLVYGTYHIAKDFDLNLSKAHGLFSRDWRAHDGFTKWVLAYALLRFDIFSFFYDRGILLPPNGRIWLEPAELDVLKRAGKRIYTYAYGADVRTRETTLKLGTYNFCVDCPSPGKFCICDEAEAKRNIDGIRLKANAMVAMGDMIHYVPGCRNFHYWPLDVDKVGYVGARWTGDRPLKLLHAPNHMHFKGSRHLFAAVERLKAEGAPLELTTISGVSNAEVLAAMAETDVVAEQFIGGAFGYTAVEAWTMGKPVLTFVRDPAMTPSWDDFPGINVDPDTLYATLKDLLSGRYDLAEIGRASRRYAEAHYSLEAVALNLGALYLETGDLDPPVADAVKASMERLRALQADRLARPLVSPAEPSQTESVAESEPLRSIAGRR